MSESEEMYLISIAQLNEAGIASPIPLSQLASALQVQTVSVNQMVRKLEDAGMLVYSPYQGVELTTPGKKAAASVLRKRRLWEVFLVESLHLATAEAEAAACRLEHLLSDKAVERLSEYLGDPVVSPQGKSIPPAQTEMEPVFALPLHELHAGYKGTIIRIQADSATRSFLATQGITPESQIHLQAKGSQGELLVTSESGMTTHIAAPVANCIFVGKIK